MSDLGPSWPPFFSCFLLFFFFFFSFYKISIFQIIGLATVVKQIQTVTQETASFVIHQEVVVVRVPGGRNEGPSLKAGGETTK